MIYGEVFVTMFALQTEQTPRRSMWPEHEGIRSTIENHSGSHQLLRSLQARACGPGRMRCSPRESATHSTLRYGRSSMSSIVNVRYGAHGIAPVRSQSIRSRPDAQSMSACAVYL